MIIANTSLEAIITGLTAAFWAQLIKFIGYMISHRKINFKILSTTGGMPSSHSAGTVGLATSVGCIAGFDSMEFAISAGMALVVMYDAAGLRRAAGKTAASLNKLMNDYYAGTLSEHSGERLKELLGHTPLEVIMGAILGILYAFYTHYVIFV